MGFWLGFFVCFKKGDKTANSEEICSGVKISKQQCITVFSTDSVILVLTYMIRGCKEYKITQI